MQQQRSLVPGLFLLLVFLSNCAPAAQLERGHQQVRRIDPDAETGSAAAVVVGEASLAHTAQVLPLDERGRLVGAEDTAAQTDRVLENLRLSLAQAGSNMGDLIKINVYTTSNRAADRVRKRFANTFTGAIKPAVTYVVGNLPLKGAEVAMDAIAVAPTHRGLRIYHSPSLPGTADRSQVAVMPPGGRIYVSGQAAKGDLTEATQETIQSLYATLAYLGLSAEDVVQIKAFMHPVEDAAKVEREIAAFYRKKPMPPLVFVEWNSSLPIEIELIATRGTEALPRSEGHAVSYITPPFMSTSPIFSRVAEVHQGDLVYVSGLYGDPSAEAESQIRAIFHRLDQVLEKAGSGLDHLAKATYYVADEAASRKLNEIRPIFYDPARPPAASKAMVRGSGLEGTTATLDMIAVVPPR